MSLDYVALAGRVAAIVDGIDPQNPPSEPHKLIAAEYLAYALEAESTGADFTGGGDLSLLEAAFLSDNSPGVPANMAAKLCAYWSGAAIPAATGHGGVPVSVVVAGAAQLAAMSAAIAGQITATAKPDAFEVFFGAIEGVVNTMVVTVVETMPSGSPQTFTGSIS